MKYRPLFAVIGIATALAGVLAMGATGCGDDGSAQPADQDAQGDVLEAGSETSTPLEHFKANVRRTSLGIPHVKAETLGGAGYGYGYVFAQDNLCILLEEILTVRGERAKWFGDVPYDLGNTSSRSNVSSDAVYRMLMTPEVVQKSREALDPEMQSMVRGYAAGVSRYVREIKAGEHPDRHATCRNEGWLREINDEDLYFRFYKLILLGSSTNFIDAIAAAQPLVAHKEAQNRSSAHSSQNDNRDVADGLELIAPKFMSMRRGEVGSNMYAFGSEVTGGAGIQFGNPHFPWYGGERLYQVHLTVPGKMDIEGASLYGVPVVLIGFNETFAWSHTVSTAYRFTPYGLFLKPGDPLTYIQDDVEKKITPVTSEIEVKGGEKRTVTTYKSEYGPMIYLGNPAFDWTVEQAFTIRDANADNYRLIRQYAKWNMAKTLDEFKRIQADELGTPWVNTTATDKNGDVYYADVTVIPNVPDALAQSCKFTFLSDLIARQAVGLPLLNGSKKSCDWVVDPASPQPGTFAAASLPKVERKDWVVNCNDSYWLTNPNSPTTGFPAIIGREAYEQSLRSRLCHQQVLDRMSGPDKTFTAEVVKGIVLGSRVYSAEKFKTTLTGALCASPTIQLTKDPLTNDNFEPPVSIATDDACSALANWDNTTNENATGSVLWDEFWRRVNVLIDTDVVTFDVPFSAADPVNTPTSPNTTSPQLAQAFAAAIHAVKAAKVALDAPRSLVSYREGKGGPDDRIPIPGGFQEAGNFTIAQVPNPRLKQGIGYGPMNYGNSYLQVVTWGAKGLDASTFVTYSLSTDKASPHYDDYTRRYSKKEWLKAPFAEADIAADVKETLNLEQ